MKVNFITGNQYKFEIGQKAMAGNEVELVMKSIDLPEIQSDSSEEVAKFSARWAAKELNGPVIVTDAGYYIPTLNGFPGPFIKYINQWLTPADLLHLMEGKTDRSVEVRACLAYCEPGQEPTTFTMTVRGQLATTASTAPGEITTISRLFIPEGHDKPEGELPREQAIAFWASQEKYYQELADYLSKKV